MGRQRKSTALEQGDALMLAALCFFVSYTVAIPHPFIHPLHWALSGASGIWGYVAWTAWTRWGGRWREKTLGDLFAGRERQP